MHVHIFDTFKPIFKRIFRNAYLYLKIVQCKYIWVWSRRIWGWNKGRGRRWRSYFYPQHSDKAIRVSDQSSSRWAARGSCLKSIRNGGSENKNNSLEKSNPRGRGIPREGARGRDSNKYELEGREKIGPVLCLSQ